MSIENSAPLDDPGRRLYREVIEELVTQTQEGSGQIAAHQVREGEWHLGDLEEREAVHQLLAHLDANERELLGRLLNQAFTDGIHECLVALYEHKVTPFDDGYEGSPYQDYMGRLEGWAWPHGAM